MSFFGLDILTAYPPFGATTPVSTLASTDGVFGEFDDALQPRANRRPGRRAIQAAMPTVIPKRQAHLVRPTRPTTIRRHRTIPPHRRITRRTAICRAPAPQALFHRMHFRAKGKPPRRTNQVVIPPTRTRLQAVPRPTQDQVRAMQRVVRLNHNRTLSHRIHLPRNPQHLPIQRLPNNAYC